MILPTQPLQAGSTNPRRLFIFSAPKVGKTSMVSGLPNALLIDVEDGSEFISAMRINVKKKALEEKKQPLDVLREISTALSKREVVYDYIIIDTATELENIAKDLALILYKNSAQGKNFTGNDVLTLPNGAGYMWLRDAFERLLALFDSYPTKCFILLGHVKKASILKDGKELSARDVDLSGKLKQIVCSAADAIGYLYRDKETKKNILSFKTSEQDMATGARPLHIRNQEFVISEEIEGKIVTHWDKIFINS